MVVVVIVILTEASTLAPLSSLGSGKERERERERKEIKKGKRRKVSKREGESKNAKK